MPEKPAAERTEQPTPDRLRKAREEGQVPQSNEVPSALMVGAMLVVSGLAAGPLLRWLAGQAHRGLSLQTHRPLTAESLAERLRSCGWESLWVLAPFLLVAAGISVAGSLLAGGWAWSPKALAWKFERLSPVAGLRNLVSLRSLVGMLTSVAKLGVIVLIVWSYLRGRLQEVLLLQWAEPAAAVRGVGGILLGTAGRIVVGLMAIAGIDLLYQRWHWRKELRMTRQEVKEERRQHEPAPELKGRIRAIQYALARRRMLQDVPKADVVLVNPTHVAVALRYQPRQMDAPQVLAKGGDFLCEKIKEVARRHGVPVVQRPELARALYASVEVGSPVPEGLFVAVAEVLAMIYRLRNRRIGT